MGRGKLGAWCSVSHVRRDDTLHLSNLLFAATVFVKSDDSSPYNDSWQVVDQLPLWFWGLVATLSTLVSLGLIFLLYKVGLVRCRPPPDLPVVPEEAVGWRGGGGGGPVPPLQVSPHTSIRRPADMQE